MVFQVCRVCRPTGLAVTALSLSEGGSFADVNGDNIVDRIMVLESKAAARTHGESFGHDSGNAPEHCNIMVISGLPATHQLFNGTVCKKGHSLHDPMNLHARRGRPGELPSHPDTISAAPPLIMRTHSERSIIESHIKNIVIAINAGVVTSYTGQGEFRFQVTGAPTWEEGFPHVSAQAFDTDADRAYEMGLHDNMHSDILIMGDSALGLVSTDGYLLSNVAIPKPPITKPAVGDFDNDGVTDVIIVTSDAILGYRLEVQVGSRGLLIAVVLLCLFAFAMYASTIQISSQNVGNVEGAGGVRQVRVLSSRRSTDEHHMD